MAACKRVFQLGSNSAICLSKLSKFESAKSKLYGTTAAASNSSANQLSYRSISQHVNLNGSRAFLVDTLALVSSFVFSFLNTEFVNRWKLYLFLGLIMRLIILLLDDWIRADLFNLTLYEFWFVSLHVKKLVVDSDISQGPVE